MEELVCLARASPSDQCHAIIDIETLGCALWSRAVGQYLLECRAQLQEMLMHRRPLPRRSAGAGTEHGASISIFIELENAISQQLGIVDRQQLAIHFSLNHLPYESGIGTHCADAMSHLSRSSPSASDTPATVNAPLGIPTACRSTSVSYQSVLCPEGRTVVFSPNQREP